MSSTGNAQQLTMNGTPAEPAAKRKRRRGPSPRFKPDTTRQMDGVRGCPALQVPAGHLARKLQEVIGNLDTSQMEAQYSSLGRHGFHPKRVLGVWVYASLQGVHAASQVAEALKTDAVYRFLSGGQAISVDTLRRFRRRFGQWAPSLHAQILAEAVKQQLVKPDDLALDSVRLRADASIKQVRTLECAEERARELEASLPEKVALADATAAARLEAESSPPPDCDEERASAQKGAFAELTEQARRASEALARLRAQLAAYREAIAQCRVEDRIRLLLTCPSGSVIKFPYGASMPGHRLTTVVSGARSRFIVALLIDATSSDYGKLQPLMERTREALTAAGIPEDEPLQVASDAGYFGPRDLAYAAEARPLVDVLINIPAPTAAREQDKKTLKYFGHDDFRIDLDSLVVKCPAGTAMKGPVREGGEIQSWFGVGCGACPMRTKCTAAERRKITVRVAFERDRQAMKTRMGEEGASERYKKRIATVEPAYAYLEDVMSFRRLTTRRAESVHSEINLKVFAYNLRRLLFCVPSFLVLIEVLEDDDAVRVRLWAPPEARGPALEGPDGP
jgi:transposase